MGMMIDGRWDAAADRRTLEVTAGRFERKPSRFRDAVRRDGSTRFQPAAGRYHLYVALNCPWAHRVILMRRLKGLVHAISMSVAIPNGRENGWEFGEFPGAGPDAVNGFRYLYQAYATADPHYTGVVSVPVLWDTLHRTIVNNESWEILRMLNDEFAGIATNPYDFRPEALRAEIDALGLRMYEALNNGVYRAGFAASQSAYEDVHAQVFACLDELEARLSRQRYLAGNRITEADIRCFVTLVRFDPVYGNLFKCSLRRIADYPNLRGYLRDLYQTPGWAETVDFDHIVRGYYAVRARNPGGIIPHVPDMQLDAPHGRDARFSRPAA